MQLHLALLSLRCKLFVRSSELFFSLQVSKILQFDYTLGQNRIVAFLIRAAIETTVQRQLTKAFDSVHILKLQRALKINRENIQEKYANPIKYFCELVR